ncbi:terpenoid synthase [Ascodesmis nigricans]|uniref:Terpenoid synthase n=1 Tax=Ascodesmis nigricans TaxID=341454 RepID=A0A4S2N8T6_9PEZI|nr:terpenoid synthase [Ascodesmis nigricans]
MPPSEHLPHHQPGIETIYADGPVENKAPKFLASNGRTLDSVLSNHNFDFSQTPVWSPTKEKILLGPYDYLCANPGKDIRRQLAAAFNDWLQVPPETLDIIVSVISKLHTASLLVDDVEDSSELRRGAPVAHSIFGIAQTINTANYVYFCALAEVAKLQKPECLQIYTEELLNLHRGQGLELHWRDNLICPTVEDYLEMVSNKTGGLFRLAIKLMQASSTSPHDFIPLVNHIGLIFQIRDDYINLQSSQYQDNKGFCEDLTEGKFSFPIIHAIRKDPDNLQLINILKHKTTQIEVKKYAVEYMRKMGSFDYTLGVLRELESKAREMIAGFGGNPGLEMILDRLKM